MVKPQDLLVTLKLASLGGDESTTFSALADTLFMSASEVFAATKRARDCHLLVERLEPVTGAARYQPVTTNLHEFLISGLRYVFPAEPGKATRGFRTAQDAPPLASRIVRAPGRESASRLPLAAHPRNEPPVTRRGGRRNLASRLAGTS